MHVHCCLMLFTLLVAGRSSTFSRHLVFFAEVIDYILKISHEIS